MKIEKTIDISKDSAKVFDYLRLTRNQDNFSVWNMADPGMKKTFTGEDGKVGYTYSWESEMKNVGAGEQKITSVDEGSAIKYDIRFFRPMKNTGTSEFKVSSAGSSASRVTWIFESPSKFPMSLFAPIFKKMLGKDLEKGLQNLKNILEQN
jgi:imidazole glycerol phosphate synthase subunit HisF